MNRTDERGVFGGKKYGQATVLFTFVLAIAAVAALALAMERGYVGDQGQFFQNSAEAGQQLPENDRARGLVFDGLLPGGSDCPGGFIVDVPGEKICTHGPDAGPPGLDIANPPGLDAISNRLDAAAPAAIDAGQHVHADGILHDHNLKPAQGTSGDAALAVSSDGVQAIGDGVSGNRVQVVYAVAAGQPDRYNEVAPLIAGWAAHMDAMMNQSAALTGGERRIRFVTNSAGALDVEKVVLPSDGDDSFSKTISAMKALGYNDGARKYLIWTDASIYCGIASIYSDDRPTQDNYNNGRFAQYARVDTGCWGLSNSVELHEIVHNMGGVQQSAPHSTPSYHCTDEYDRMCYRDSSSVQMTYVCGNSMEAYLDCGNDDYFHTSPPSGSYLATHWNVASSSFLHAGPGGDPPPPSNTAPDVSVSGPGSLLVTSSAWLDGAVVDDGMPGPYATSWSKTSGPGTVTFSAPTAEDTSAAFSAAGSYILELKADDGELTGSASITITVEEETITNTAPVVSVSGPTSVTLPSEILLDGTVTDDGLIGSYTVAWTRDSGPGTVSFGNTLAEDTSVAFSAAGTYVLTLTANDGELTGSNSITIVVEEETIPNTAPVVAISSSSSATLPNPVSLNGSVTDDGQPGPYTVAWSKGSGPGTVTFSDPTAEDTSATFSMAGTYVLVLAADDGELTGSGSVTVTVEEAPAPEPTPLTETFSDSLNKRFPIRTYQITAAGGAGEAKLTFDTKTRGKNASTTQLTINVYDASGTRIATGTSDTGLVILDLSLTGGNYTFEVTGSQSSFTLAVKYPSP